jgi:hypothetical protein
VTVAAPYPVTAATGLPETWLPESLVAQLPTTVAGAPWRTKCRVVTWLHTVDDDALDALPPEIRSAGISLVAWALVRYADTPVGPYDEVAATLLPADGDYGHIPFIVVDSLPSIVGGRTNWLLPKALAEFDWDDENNAVTISAHIPASPAWRMRVSFEAAGDASPLEVPNHVQQVSTDGEVRSFDGTMTGAMRSATVTVDGHADGPLSSLLIPGHYDGTMLTDCEFNVGALNPG